jgi:hypothetical protein
MYSAPATKIDSDVDDEYGSDNYEDEYEQDDTAIATAIANSDDDAVDDRADVTARADITIAATDDDAVNTNDQYVSSPLTDHSETLDSATDAAVTAAAVAEHVESLPLDEQPLHRQQLQSPTAIQQQQQAASLMLLQSSCEASVFDPTKTGGAKYPIANKQPSISNVVSSGSTAAAAVTAAAANTTAVTAVANAKLDTDEQAYDSDAFDADNDDANDDFEPDGDNIVNNNNKDDDVVVDENEESLSLSLSIASDKAVHNNQVYILLPTTLLSYTVIMLCMQVAVHMSDYYKASTISYHHDDDIVLHECYVSRITTSGQGAY